MLNFFEYRSIHGISPVSPRRDGLRQKGQGRQGCAALLAVTLAGAWSLANAETGEQVAKSGNTAGAPACVTCHGAAGQGQGAAGFPRLAGMNAKYLVTQLRSFQDGTRVNPIMGPVAQMLGVADVRGLATYYAALPAVGASGNADGSRAVVAAGEALAKNGRWTNGIPACAQCHGATGLGVGAVVPQIAGQSVVYISNQLQAWQVGTRKNDPMGLMHGIALKLSATDVSAVAVYYAGLPAASAAPGQARP
ncbi:MAG: c-type cytochrome [Rhodoferax sp.]|uniref:c-type cytochrome n=1 Tax=Rhodoferax sp. TaxID=50421 RepID=UPI003BB7828F|nr:c-type cytochrome [Rhodoferax sp.]